MTEHGFIFKNCINRIYMHKDLNKNHAYGWMHLKYEFRKV